MVWFCQETGLVPVSDEAHCSLGGNLYLQRAMVGIKDRTDHDFFQK